MQSELDNEDRAKLAEVRDALKQVPSQRRHLIPMLQRVQQTLSYLPTDAIDLVAKHFNLTRSDVYGVATFYNQFRFNPPGRHPVRVCMGTACHVKGGDIILEHFERKLEIKEGETTADREFSIDRVACVGCCALAPVALMGETLHGHMMTSKVEGLILRVNIEKEKAERERLKNERLEKRASGEGASPEGVSPEGASPEGASPEGASPVGASPVGASPVGATTK